MRLDNGDAPLSQPRWQRRADALRHALIHAGSVLPDACIHGHFLPLKYALARHTRFAVWLRDPVQRVVSRYQHYLRHGQDEPQHARWGLAPGLSLEQFVRLPQYHNTYAESFWAFALRRFEFIGIVESYDADIARFARIFGFDLDLRGEPANRNPQRTSAAYVVEPAVERLIRRFNARDLAIYEWARQRGV
jgi:hypothetical protein